MAARRVVTALARRLRDLADPRTPGPDFDVDFYRELNTDLHPALSDAGLIRHYLDFGRAEGRPAHRAAALAALEAEHGALPEDFDAAEYQALNPDLLRLLPTAWAATEHYLKFGAREGRRYRLVDLDLYAALNGIEDLDEAGLKAHFAANRDRPGVLATGADFMRARGVTGGGRWLERLDLIGFCALNWTWAGGVTNKRQAGEAVLNQGLERMAPLGFDLAFEPGFYRETHPDLAARSDPELYRRWLFEGLERNEPGSTEAQLARFGLEASAYPAGFDWRAYARSHKLEASRWPALAHFMRHGARFAAMPPTTDGDGGRGFLAAAAAAFASRDDHYAIRLWAEAAARAPLTAAEQTALAGAHFRLGQWAEAGRLHQALATYPEADVDTLAKGAAALMHVGDLEGTADLLLRTAERFRGDGAFRRLAGALAEAVFHRAVEAARPLYRAGERAQADARLTAVVDEVQSLWSELDPIGAALPPAQTQRVAILANTDLRQCTHYRVEQKAEVLAYLGYDHAIFSADRVDDFLSALPGAAAAIFYRVTAEPRVIRAIEAARAIGVVTYYEIDDQIFAPAYPEPIETYGGAVSPDEYVGLEVGVPLFRAAMARCDYAIASTDALAKDMAPLVRSGRAFSVFNGLDNRIEAAAAAPRPRLRPADELVVFYGSGTKAHNSDFLELAAPGLLRLLAEHPEARLVIAGYLVLDARFDPYRQRIRQVGFTANVQAFWSILAEADINLAVLRPGPVTDGKSEIKWLEAAAFAIPSIVSDTRTYLDRLTDGEDALIATDGEDWSAKLDRLARDPALRRRIGAAAKVKALRDYSVAASARRLATALKPAFSRPSPKGAKPRVMLVNAFFPPQTIGGATRVVRDNLDDLADGDFDFAVAASDPAEPTPGWLRVDAYGETPVFRLSAPRAATEWRPFNPEMGALFARALDLWRPDLVHFHAMQRLTASPLEVCRERGVPYAVTVHDAWWIADHQFLIDERGVLVDPTEPLSARPPKGVGLGESLDRRRRLIDLLNGAEAVWAVSERFARLYRDCGIAKAEALPNGVHPASRRPRTASPSGRVRLAHVGGRTVHKGDHLIQAALREGRFAHLELTVVDHDRTGGAVRGDTWGATPVRIVGRTPQERMAGFYAEQDVLLAPSIWPESYGLVTREALAEGLWVVAGDRGAIGDDVRQGVNGFLVDVASPQGLFDTLAEIDADPDRYRVSPPPTALRSAKAQSAELAALYRRIIAA